MQLDSPIRLVSDPTLGLPRLVLTGRVTVAEIDDLHRAALRAASDTGGATVDLTAADYLDTAAIQVLIALRRELEVDGHRLEIVGASPVLTNDLRLAGWDSAGR